MINSNPQTQKAQKAANHAKSTPPRRRSVLDLKISVTETGHNSLPRRRGYVLNALAFSTLLSSQETDAHHQQPHGRLQGNYSNLPDGYPLVNEVHVNFVIHEGFLPTQHTLPDMLPQSRKPVRSRCPGGSPRPWPATWRSVPRGARRTLEMDWALVKSESDVRAHPARPHAELRRVFRGQRPRNRLTVPRKSPSG